MRYQFVIILGLVIFSSQQTFLEEKNEDIQEFPDDLDESGSEIETFDIKDFLGFQANKCSDPYTSSPHYTTKGCNKLGQCNGHDCGPHSIHQVLKKFGIEDYHELQIAKMAGTTTGTSHEGINKAIKAISVKKGVKMSIEWKNFSSFGSTLKERFTALAKIICQPNKDIIIHLLYRNRADWGHYETISGIDIASQRITVLNSLWEKQGAGYTGTIESRKFSDMASYISGIGQPSIAIITKG